MSETGTNEIVGARTWALRTVVVRHTRLDSRRPALALLSTVAHPS